MTAPATSDPPRCEALDNEYDNDYYARAETRVPCDLPAEFILPGNHGLPPMFLCEPHADRYDPGGAVREELPDERPHVPAYPTDRRQTRLAPREAA